MPNIGSLVTSFSSAGIGTGIGYITAALIQTRNHKRTKAQDVSALVTAANTITDRLMQRNNELIHINAQARQALSKLVDAVQAAQDRFRELPDVCDESTTLMATLQAALDAANAVEI